LLDVLWDEGSAELKQQLLFVYGTLKRGFVRHPVLQDESFYGTAVTVNSYRLLDCGSYPGLVSSDDGLAVQGEVYGVSDECLAVCDEVEGVAEGLYAREMISVQSLADPEERVDAWVYLYLGSTTNLPNCGFAWPPDDSADSNAVRNDI